MKKIVMMLLVIISVFSLLSTSEAAPKQTWDEFVAKMEKKEKIETVGLPVLEQYKANPVSGSELELWNKLWESSNAEKSRVAVTLISQMFPDGDVSRWEEIDGFIEHATLRPRQLLALDALFVAISSLSTNDKDIWAASYLLQQFSKSSAGNLKFIAEMPEGLRPTIDKIIAVTGLTGVWETTKTTGKMPLLPAYQGTITRSLADDRNMTYLDGFGRIASNGSYAWDRDRGYLYKVKEDTNRESKIN
ncbi:MAG: hypothetical protein RR272_00915 [Synergistaceae bacterium]